MELCRTAVFLCGLVLSSPIGAQGTQETADVPAGIQLAEPVDRLPPEPPREEEPSVLSPFGDEDFGIYDADDIDLLSDDGDLAAPKSTRVTLGHEVAYRVGGEQGLVNNRSSFRLEYSKFFLDSFFAQLDFKLNGFWSNDHRAEAENKTLLFDTLVPEAFVQYSKPGSNFSVKLGVQKLIWGESEGGVITDVVSPRNFSELFFIPLEESRLGQFMLSVDHFSSVGDWTYFFVPRAKFNELPEEGTAYFFDPFAGSAAVRDDPADPDRHEYGMRWKRTFGQSDIAFMAASVIDNDYAFRLDGVTESGLPLISRVAHRYTLAGLTFNYARGDFLFKGEVGYKSPLAFNDAALQIIERDVIDSSLGLTYSLGQSNSLGMEIVNRHVLNWSDEIVGVRRNTSALVLNNNFFFLNDTLSVNWLTIYSQPFTSVTSSVRTSYKWSDNLTFSLDAHVIAVPDRGSELHRFRDEDQVFFGVQYQF